MIAQSREASAKEIGKKRERKNSDDEKKLLEVVT